MSEDQATLIKIDEVMRRTTLSRAYIYRKIKNGEFPQQVVLGKQSSAWFEHEIDAWLRALPRSRS